MQRKIVESNGNVSLCGTKSEQSAGHNLKCIAGRTVGELLHSLDSKDASLPKRRSGALL